MKRIAILQSNYIPWKGYFDIINMVDEFVIYDDAQYTVRDWRNRNLIKTRNGLKWLTIPVETQGYRKQKINETKVANQNWPIKHWDTIRHNYKTAPYFRKYEDIFAATYIECKKLKYLSEINRVFIDMVVKKLCISTLITISQDYNLQGDKSGKIISICRESGADIYVSGPSAKKYINEKIFSDEGISLMWMDYNGYPEYSQLNPPFCHTVSIIDLIFNKGEQACFYMKSFK